LGNLRNLAFWFVLFILLLMLFRLFSGDAGTASSRSTTYSDFVQAVENGQVSRATLDGETVTYTGPNGTEYVTIVPGDAQISELLVSKGERCGHVARNVNVPIDSIVAPANHASGWGVDLFHEPDAGRWQRRRYGLWQEPREDADRKARQCHL